MGLPTQQERLSLRSFWATGLARAFRESWEKYGNAGLICGLVYLVVAFFFSSWIRRKFPTTDINLWITLGIPAVVLAIAFVYHLVKAPYEIYRDLYQNIEGLENKNKNLQDQLRAKLKVDCGRHVFGSFTPRTDTAIRTGGVPLPRIAHYHRLAVKADCIGVIRGCKGYLDRVERNGEIIWGGDEAVLPFAPANQKDSVAKEITDKGTAFLDVLATTNQNEILICAIIWRYQPFSVIFDRRGIYVLVVLVTSPETASVRAFLNFDWNCDWETATLTLDHVE